MDKLPPTSMTAIEVIPTVGSNLSCAMTIGIMLGIPSNQETTM
jgi:hypothetical protein